MSGRRVLDLFCGAAGGWSLGLHRAGFQTVAACEIDPWRRAIFAHNFPDVVMYDDVRAVTAERLRADLGGMPDTIVGSPPCQDASSANPKGRGVDGERTGLFFEAFRIVGECRPRWCAFENSPTLRTRGYDRLQDALEAIGYAVWPPVVGADNLRAPHKRKRVWIIAFDTQSIRPACGRTWGYGPKGFAQSSNHKDAAYAAAIECEGVAGSIRGGGQAEARSGARDFINVADAHGDGLWLEPGRSSGTNWNCSPVPQSDRSDPAGLGRGQERSRPEEYRDGADDRESDVERQVAALEAAIGPAVHSWNGGVARHLRMAHGLAARLAGIRVADFKHPGATINAAKACISAQGDAILPQISEAIGRAIIRTEAALECVSAIRARAAGVPVGEVE